MFACGVLLRASLSSVRRNAGKVVIVVFLGSLAGLASLFAFLVTTPTSIVTDVGTSMTALFPDWLVYVTAALLVGLSILTIKRFIKGMR